MTKSDATFHRWVPGEPSTWPFQVFRQYNLELNKMYWSLLAAGKLAYKSLGSSGAKWADRPEKHLAIPSERSNMYRDLEEWSENLSRFLHWTRLNAVIAITSNLETYMAAAIRLALESDPGVLLGKKRAVDGAAILKHGSNGLNIDDHIKEHIKNCTKGDWTSRNAAYKALFGTIPPTLQQKTAELDRMRNLRNQIGHAFGRDIEQVRQHGMKEAIPMVPLSPERMQKCQSIAFLCAKEIDRHLIRGHIGEYQSLHFYHRLAPTISMNSHASVRAIALKKALGQFKAVSRGKLFCKGLVSFYDAL